MKKKNIYNWGTPINNILTSYQLINNNTPKVVNIPGHSQAFLPISENSHQVMFPKIALPYSTDCSLVLNFYTLYIIIFYKI